MACPVLKPTAEDNILPRESAPPSVALGEPIFGSLLVEDGLVHLLREAADAGSDRGILFVQDDESEVFLSYRELLHCATMRLGALQREGLHAGSTAILLQSESREFLISFWACILGGIIPAPLAYPSSFTAVNDPLSKLHGVWNQLRQPPILSNDAVADQTASIEGVLGIEALRILSTTRLDEDGAPGRLLDGGYLDRTAFVQFSSGSTGRPKGVTLTHRNLITNFEASICAIEITEQDRMLSWMPYHHDMGIIGFHLVPLAAGCVQINLTPLQFLKSPRLWLAKIAEHRATITGSPNFGYQCVLDKVQDDEIARWDLRCVRLIFNGAEPISPDVMRRFQSRLAPAGLAPTSMYPVYGMAEASLAVTFPPVRTEPIVHCVDRQRLVGEGVVQAVAPDDKRALRVVDLGSPVPSCGVRIVNDEDEVVPEGRVGHVQIQGGNVTAGYFENPDENQRAFREGWLRTGDLGFMLGGRLTITGRAKDIIFVNGQNFFAFDLERCAAEVEGVLERKVVAAGWTDEALGREQVVLFLSARIPRGSGRTRRQIYADVWRHLNERTGVSVDYIVPLQSVPKTTSGKVQRYRLLQDFREGKYDESALSRADVLGEDRPATQPETRTDTEARIGRIWGEVLGRQPESFSVDSPFLSVGGSSLKAVHVLARLEEDFGTSLPQGILIQCRTVREMAGYLEVHLTALGRPLHNSSSPPPSVSVRSDRLARSTPAEPAGEIAIVGLGCRFPGADSPERFWHNLVQGRDGVREIPRDRWDSARYYEAGQASSGRTSSRWGGFIDEPYAFDAGLFGVSDEEAATMDPQQRLFLETAWQTLDHAGYGGRRSDGRRVGLFVGASHNNYLEYHLHSLALMELQRFRSFERLPEESQAALVQEWKERYGSLQLHPYTAVSNLLNMIAARTSHTLNLKGPSLAVDTACSASLVAVHLACESLRRGECEMAIAGGVNLLLTPTPYLLFSRSGALSPTGRCRVFDAAADGFVPGEGAGAVMLKPLEKARQDRDAILAVIKASAMNNDGRSLGVMAPNPDGQREVIAFVYRAHGLSPRDVQYVEAHGTGTAIGDPSEVRALAQAFAEFTPEKGYCAIGSVKANIGHLLSAAGIASLIKVVLGLQARQMPPSVHLRSPNPLIKFKETPFLLLDQAREWAAEEGKPRRAAINSFGFGGTNCHMVVEEAGTPDTEAAAPARPQQVLCLSARSQASLRRRATEMAAHLVQNPQLDVRDVCFTANAGRAHFPYRAAMTAGSLEGLVERLHKVPADAPKSTSPRLALMFTGQGAQYPGMARRLYQTQPTFKRFLDEVAACFDGFFEAPLVEMMLGERADAARLARTDVTQPVMFCIDHAIGRLLLHWGVEPAVLFGHSVGEYAAACLAGVLDLADAARLVAARGWLMQALPSSGAMAAVFTSSETLAPWLEPYAGRLWIAAYNGSHQVVSGGAAALDQFLAETQARGVSATRLQVSQAFHTPLMQPILEEFRAVVDSVTFREPRIPLLSNVSGEWIESKGGGIDAAYWAQHVLAPVRFEQSVRRAVEGGITLFLEAGPDKTLAGLVRAITAGQPGVHVAAALDRKRDNWESLSQALAGLYERGVPLDFEAFHADDCPRPVALPAYPFERQTFRPSLSSPREEPPASVGSVPAGDWLHTWSWAPEKARTAGPLPAGAVLLFTREGEMEDILGGLFDPVMNQVFRVRAGTRFEDGKQGLWTIDPRSPEDYRRLFRAVKQGSPRLAAVVHAWNVEPFEGPEAQLIDDPGFLYNSFYSLLFLAQAVWGEANGKGSAPFPLLLATHRGCAVRKDEAPRGIFQTTAIALAQTLAQEDPRFDSRVLDLDTGSPRGLGLAALLFEELQAVAPSERIAAHRDGRRWVRSLASQTGEMPGEKRRPAQGSRVELAPGETCLIVGGASGIGAELALDLARRGAVNLVLTGRQPVPPRGQWSALVPGSTAAERVRLICRLEQLGSQVLYRAVDVTDRAGMEELIGVARDRFGALHGVVHAGGVVDRRALTLRQKTAETVAAVLAPKVRGTLLLDEMTRKEPLKFFVLFSSIAASEARWGVGLADYAAANAFLDGFSAYRAQRGATGRSLALNWSLWQDRGMGRDLGLAHLIRSKGLKPLVPHRALEAFHQSLSLAEPVVHVIDFDGSALPAPAPAVPAPAPAQPAATPETPSAPVSLAEPPAVAAPPDHVRLVGRIVAAQLGIDERDVDGDRNFRELGLDSNGAVVVTAMLGEALGQTLYPTLLFEYQTPRKLAAYLDAELGRKSGRSTPLQAVVPAPLPPETGHRPQAPPVFEVASSPAVTLGDAEANAGDRRRSRPRADLREQDIAIIGMACKLPGAESLEEYWKLLVEGRSAIGEAPADRLPPACFEQDSQSSHISYSKWGAFVDRPYHFDPMFFGISPREAAVMDPQQRLFLEVAWQSLQQAGYGERRPAEVGVFVGCEQNHYGEQFINFQHYQVLRTRFAESAWFRRLDPADRRGLLATLSETLKPAEISSDVVAGNGTSEIAARLSHCLDLKGPSVMVNTACSSSLVAMHWACESLRSGESKMAVVGGVYLNFGSTPFVFLSRVQALSPDGTCAPFDRDAKGMVLGEGVSALVLKPLRQAIADRDFIHAVIKGSAINNDGHSQGITVPSPDGQAEAIRKAYRSAGLSAETINYVECHGTGTSLGDPVEVAGLTQAFRSFTERTQFCAIGSVKSSIGHMLAAAGLPSVIKVALAMKHGLIPPTVGFKQANPYIDFASTPFFVAAGGPQPWAGIDGVRRAGVNAFGFGGTNCHLILEEPPAPGQSPAESATGPHLIFLNGRTPQVVGQVAGSLRAHLQAHPELETAEVAFSMNSGQRDLACKTAVVAGSRDELLRYLEVVAAGGTEIGVQHGRSNPRKASSFHLLWGDAAPFTAEETEELAGRLPAWASARREALDACLRLAPAGQSLAATAHTFATQYALGRLLMELEIAPAGILARKTGVLAAACLTGAITLPEAASLWCGEAYPSLPVRPSPEGDSSSRESLARSWNCPVAWPGGALHSGDPQRFERLAAALVSEEEWSAEHVRNETGASGMLWSEDRASRAAAPASTPNTVALDPQQPTVQRLLDVLGRLYVAGVKLNSVALFSENVRRVLLPTYPFEHGVYRVSPPELPPDEILEPDARAGHVVQPAATPGALLALADSASHAETAPPVLRPLSPPSPPSLGDASRQTSRAALIKELAAVDFRPHETSRITVYEPPF